MSNLHGTLVAGDAVGSDYEILDVAGSGGMGVVYRARDRRLDRTVALKFLPAQLSHSARERERFLREARVASSLDHPNIGVIHAIEEAEGRGFIVMAYYDGESLARHLEEGPLCQADAVAIAMQMACGLAEAHARKIIHRDIKPSNVMLTSSGGVDRSHVRIVDFGLAQVMAQSTDTSSGAKGTLSYMSPEQAQEKHADARTDIWSLGVTLAEMLSGRNPFARDTIAATLLAILNEGPTAIPGIHPELQQIVFRALVKDMTARYQHVSEMLADLRRIQPEIPLEPETARPGDQTESGNKRQERKARSSRKSELDKAKKKASRPAVPLEYLRSRRTRARRIAYGSATLIVVLAILLFVPRVRGWLAGRFVFRGEKHIAVLPFENVSGDAGDALLVAGLMRSLADRLSNLDAGGQSLWVVPTSEVQRLNISDPTDALNKLKATLVVRGSVNKHGQYVQLTVNLIDSRNLRQLGSVEVEDADGNIASLETQVVGRLARLMNLKVPETSSNLPASPPAAYDSYLTALGYLQRYDKPGNLDLAIAELKKSVAIDPKFAVSYGKLGEAYQLKSAVSQDPQWLGAAQFSCRKAIELNPEIASAYVTLGLLYTDKQPELAMQEFQRALAIDVRSAPAQLGMAGVYVQMGRLHEAEAAYKQAISLQPNDWDLFDRLGIFYDDNRRYKEAFTAFARAMQLTPDNAQVMSNLAVAEINSADPKLQQEAERLLKRCIAVEPTYQRYASLAIFYQGSGRFAEAAAMTERALTINDRDAVVWGNLVTLYELLKQKDRADRARQKAIVAAELALESNPRKASTHALLADEYAHSGHREQALAQIESAEALAPDDPNVLANIADAYAGLGDLDQAMAAIDKAMQKGFRLGELKSDPEAKDLVAAVIKKQ